MTTLDTDRSERGRRAFADVMTVPPPEDYSPATANGLIDFVFGEWRRPMRNSRCGSMSTRH
jgi:4-carboxymuconolactone decarboxylase